MDIKKRIQELSLDQKAKLYFMGLVRQGKIDRLPEDPKAAYVQSMMNEPASSKFSEPMGETRDEEDEENERNLALDDIPDNLRELSTELGYLKEVGAPIRVIADYKKGSTQSVDGEYSIQDLLDMFEGSILTNYQPETYVEDIISPNGTIMMDISIIEDRRGDMFAIPTEDATKYHESLTEEENYQNLPKPDEISLSYTDPGFRFYGMYLYKDGNRFAKISYEDRATKYLKNLGIKTEVPRRYDEDTLDKIKQEIEALGIEGDYSAAMDVS